MLFCSICKREAIPYSRGVMGDTYRGLSWKLVDIVEYDKRVLNGMSQNLSGVCPECFEKYTGEKKKPVSELLQELQQRRMRDDGFLI